MTKKGKPSYRRGYKFIPAPPGHPRANGRGYIAEHILVMEQKLGRPVRRGEVVHHINGEKADNRPENLMLFSSDAEHLTFHKSQRHEAIRLGLQSITEGEWIGAWLADNRGHSMHQGSRRFFEANGYDPDIAKEAAAIVGYADYQLVRKKTGGSIGLEPWWSEKPFSNQVKNFFKEGIPIYVAFVQDIVAHWEKLIRQGRP